MGTVLPRNPILTSARSQCRQRGKRLGGGAKKPAQNRSLWWSSGSISLVGIGVCAMAAPP
jgi:hypothetical protein